MTTIRLIDVLKKVAPHARPEYLEAINRGGPWFIKGGLTSPTELVPFLATILEETGGLVVTWESMHYTHAARIHDVWPSRFPTLASAEPFVGQDEKLANYVYANRMGNRGISSGDGWRNRGLGLIQNTGADDRRAASEYAGLDYVNHPELMLTAEGALQPAIWEWGRSNLNALARTGNFREITRILNGGYTNMDERLKWLAIMHEHLDGMTIDLSSPDGKPWSLPETPTSQEKPMGDAALVKPGALTRPVEVPDVQVAAVPTIQKAASVIPGPHPADGLAVLAGIGSIVGISHGLSDVNPIIAIFICIVAAVAIFVIWASFRHRPGNVAVATAVTETGQPAVITAPANEPTVKPSVTAAAIPAK